MTRILVAPAHENVGAHFTCARSGRGLIRLRRINPAPTRVFSRQKVVTPVKTGVQVFRRYLNKLDSGFRRNDEKIGFRDSNLASAEALH